MSSRDRIFGWQSRTLAVVGALLVASLLSGTFLPATLLPGSKVWGQASAEEPQDEFDVMTLRGRIVWLAEAMERRHGVKTVPEASQRVLALETEAGKLYPLAEDIRGRGFRRDERLRKMDVELLVRRYHGAPVIQVIRVFELTDDGRFELDYWCDICAIAMFELKPCDCCQGDIELRRRRVDDEGRVIDP